MKRQTIERQIAMEWIVGIFMFAVLLGLFLFTIVLGQRNYFKRRYPVQIQFAEVMGLRDGDNIVVRGMPLGKIKRLKLGPDGVRVFGELEQPLVLYANYRAIVVTTSILGGRYLEIREGTPDQPGVPLSTILRGEKPFDFMAETTEVVHELKKTLTEGGALKNLEVSLGNIRVVTDKINSGQGTLGRLVNDEDLYTNILTITHDAQKTTAQLNEVLSRINRGEGSLGHLLKDDALYSNLQATSSNLMLVSQRLADGKGTLGRLLAEDETLYKDLTDAVRTLKDIAARMDRGEGLLGKLSRDETLYDEVKAMVKELRAAVDDFRETSPVTTFTSILFGAL
jgi:phospholipid/cholesterol/gamma-HCH transport system substrate-binding protein